jgi:hypothetical protein
MQLPRVTFDPKKHIDLGSAMDGRMRIQNPWTDIQRDGRFVLEIDREDVEHYNEKKLKPHHKVDTSLIPEPFIGNPKSAKLVLLSLNPGLEEGDAEAHARPDFRAAMIGNLHHELKDDAFYPLNPQFKDTPCADWWLKKTRQLVEECGREKVARGLFVIEWFPYHSKKSGLPKKFVCESQRYSCQLAKEMLGKGALMVLLRSRDHWAVCGEGLSKLPLPRSRQNPAISAANFGDDIFQQMCEALKT